MNEHYVDGVSGMEPVDCFIGGRVSKLLEQTSFISLSVAIVSAALLFTPVSWIGSATLKMLVVSVCVVISAICLLLNSIDAVKQKWYGSRLIRFSILAVFLLPITYLASWFLNGHAVSLFDGISMDTLLFTLLSAVTFSIAALVVNTEYRSYKILQILFFSVCATILYQYFSIMTGTPWLQGGDIANTLTGKWNELGVLSVTGIFMLLTGVFIAKTRLIAYLQLTGIMFMLFMLFVINFDLAWYFLLVGAVVGIILPWIMPCCCSADESGADKATYIRKYSTYIVAIVALAGIFWSNTINTYLPAPFLVQTSEVRPSLSGTLDLARATHGTRMQAALGAGPNSFQEAWMSHKPISVNLTQFWGVEFPSGFSNITTSFFSSGYIGVIGWTIPFLVVCIACFLMWLNRHRLELCKLRTARTLMLMAVVMWASMLFYVVGLAVVLLFFIFAGASVGYTAALLEGLSSKKAIDTLYGRYVVLVGYALLALVALISVGMVMRYALSSSYYGMSASVFSSNDIQKAQKLNNIAIQIQPTEDNLRLAMIMDYALLQKIASATTTPDTIASIQKQFTDVFQDAIAQGQKSIQLNPRNYRPYAEIAQFFELLASLKVPGADVTAEQYYKEAAKLNPTNPTIPFMVARMKANTNTRDNLESITKQLSAAIELKGNYTDAFVLAEQVAIALNDIKSATVAAENAVRSAQDQPELWFQLGMLYYTAGNNKGAVEVFKQAITIAPNHLYPNAEYFLGIAYYKLGQVQDAVTVFTDIAKNNPNNTQIKLILSDLSTGKNPFVYKTANNSK